MFLATVMVNKDEY